MLYLDDCVQEIGVPFLVIKDKKNNSGIILIVIIKFTNNYPTIVGLDVIIIYN